MCWVGGAGGVEESLTARAGIPFESISAAGVRGKNPLAIMGGIWALSRGFWQARRLLGSFGPDVLFVTGGYVCVPVTLAAWLAGVPALIYLPDVRPGMAIRFLARFADMVAVTVPSAMNHFRPGQTVPRHRDHGRRVLHLLQQPCRQGGCVTKIRPGLFPWLRERQRPGGGAKSGVIFSVTSSPWYVSWASLSSTPSGSNPP